MAPPRPASPTSGAPRSVAPRSGAPRYRSGATTFAFEHRAFAVRPGAARIVAGAAAGTVFALGAWLVLLPHVSRLWGHALAALAAALPAAPQAAAPRVVMALQHVGPVTVGVPSLSLPTVLPSAALVAATAAVVVLLAWATHLAPESWRPGVYFARALLIIQTTAVVYFALWADHFPYTVAGYLEGMTATGIAVATAAVVVLGLTYYVQDIAVWRKALLTVLVLAYSAVLVPLQYAVHGLVLAQASVLFLPVLYLFFGVPLHVFALVALYAWGMSWPGRDVALGIPLASSPT